MVNNYEGFSKETEPTTCWEKIDILIDPAYYRYHHHDYTEEVKIVSDCKIGVLTFNEGAKENIPSLID